MPVFRQEGRAVLFVHVPKAGGSTLERLFGKSGWTVTHRDPKVGAGSMNSLRRVSPQHMHRTLLEQVFHLDRFDAVFMTVREPLARFRSEYAMRNADRVSAGAAEVEAWFDEAFRQYRHDPCAFDNHLRPQWEFHVPGCHVYRLEDGLQSTVDDLNARWDLGLGPVSDVPRVLDRKEASGVASSEVQLTPALEQRLRAEYSEDFVRFGY